RSRAAFSSFAAAEQAFASPSQSPARVAESCQLFADVCTGNISSRQRSIASLFIGLLKGDDDCPGFSKRGLGGRRPGLQVDQFGLLRLEGQRDRGGLRLGLFRLGVGLADLRLERLDVLFVPRALPSLDARAD